jgi:hypothetical protein
MTVQLTRRDLLKRASGLLSVAAVGGLTSIETEAAQVHQERNRVLVRNPAFATIDLFLRQAVDNGTVAGVVAMGATQRGLIYEGAFGHANPQTGTGMTTDTVFWLLSMTKAITATACMQLIEQGRLRLDQPAGEILPELKSPQVLDGFDASGQPKLRPARNTITVRHLLTHTSGFTYSIWSENMSRYEKVTGMPDIGYSMNGAFKAPLEFEPGERWQYGIGMDWVGKQFGISDQRRAEAASGNNAQPTTRRIAQARSVQDQPAARVLYGWRRCIQHAARLHGDPTDACERWDVPRRAGPACRHRFDDVPESDRRSSGNRNEDGAAGVVEQLRPVSRDASQVGVLLRHKHTAGSAWPQRGQHQLGGTAEQLFLGRSGQEGGRHAVHADSAVLRLSCGGSVRTVRAGAVSRLAARLSAD